MALIIPTSAPYVAVYGPYSQAYQGLSAGTPQLVGLTRQGWRLRWDLHEHRVDDTTSWAKALIELFYLGSDWFLSAQCLEWSADGLSALAWPYNNVTQGAHTTPGLTADVILNGVGARASALSAGSFTLGIAAAGYAASPATLFAPYAVNAGSAWDFDSRNRETQVVLRLLPSSVSTAGDGSVAAALQPYGTSPTPAAEKSAATAAAQALAAGAVNNNNAPNVTRWFWTS